ncbi:hypothetical protein COT75_05450, partial [Candidatus Beckwithbacteria bacterium CG10_big_fil_rev_8_21_14_0_10_34_10]
MESFQDIPAPLETKYFPDYIKERLQLKNLIDSGKYKFEPEEIPKYTKTYLISRIKLEIQQAKNQGKTIASENMPSYLSNLRLLVKDEDLNIRREAATALGSLGPI